MPGLGETTAMLARLRCALPGWPGSGDRAAGGESFAPNPGNLTLTTYRPDGLQSGAPLVAVLYGCSQLGEAYARDAGWIALADRFGFGVAMAQQSTANNPNRCFNWFSPGDIKRGEGEAASIAAWSPTW